MYFLAFISNFKNFFYIKKWISLMDKAIKFLYTANDKKTSKFYKYQTNTPKKI